MQKKVLLPLLLAGPVAVPAFAQVDLNSPVSGWTPEDVTPSESNKFEAADVNAMLGEGYIVSNEISLPSGNKYPAGVYQLTLNNVSNVKIAVVTQEPTEESFDEITFEDLTDGASATFEFTLDVDSNFYIVIAAKEQGSNSGLVSFSTSGNKSIVFQDWNPGNAISGLGTQLNNLWDNGIQKLPAIKSVQEEDQAPIYFNGTLNGQPVNGNDVAQETEDIRTKYPKRSSSSEEDPSLSFFGPILSVDKTQTTTAWALNNEIEINAKYKGQVYDGAKLLEIYLTWGYNENPPSPFQQIQDYLNETILPLIDEINAVNKAYDVYEANKKTYEAFTTGSGWASVKSLQDQVNARQAALDNTPNLREDQRKEIQDMIDNLNGQIEAYQDWLESDDVYPPLTEENKDHWSEKTIMTKAVNDKASELAKAIQDGYYAVTDKIKEIDANWGYYWENTVLLADLLNAYEQVLDLVNNAKGVTSFEYTEDGDVVTKDVEGWEDVFTDKSNPKSLLNVWIGNKEKPGTASDLYETTKKNNTIPATAMDNAGEPQYAKYNENIEAAIKTLNGYYEEVSDLIEDQNSAMQSALATNQGYVVRLEALKKTYQTTDEETGEVTDIELPTGAQDAFDAAIQEIQNALDAFVGEYEGEYKDAALDTTVGEIKDEVPEGYLGYKEVVDNAFNKADTLTSENGPIADILNVQNQFDAVKDFLDRENKKGNIEYSDDNENKEDNKDPEKIYYLDFSDTWNTQFTNIQNAIDALDPSSDNLSDEIKDISDDLPTLKTEIANTLWRYFDYIKPSLQSFNEAINGFGSYITTKQIPSYDGVWFNNDGEFATPHGAFTAFATFINNWNNGTTGKYNALKAQVGIYNIDLGNIKAAAGETRVKLISDMRSALFQVIGNSYTDDNQFVTDVLGQEVNFEKEGTQLNVTDISGLITLLNNHVNANTNANYGKRVGWQDASDALTALKNNVDGLSSTINSYSGTGKDAIAQYIEYDAELLAYLTGMTYTTNEEGEKVGSLNENPMEYFEGIADYVQNMDANYAAYMQMTSDLMGLVNQVADAATYNETTNKGYQKTLEYFAGVIDGYQNQITSLLAEVTAAYNKMEAQNYDQKDLTALKNNVAIIKNWIKGNLDNYLAEQVGAQNYSAQVEAAFTSAATALSSAYTDIEKELNSATEGSGEYEKLSALLTTISEWQEDLEDLQDESEDPLNLDAVNAMSTNLFNKGGLYNPNLEQPNTPHNDMWTDYYEPLKDAADQLAQNVDDEGYGNEILQINDAYLTSWQAKVKQVNANYLDGIGVYWYFENNVTNEGWEAIVSQHLESNSELKGYLDDLDALNKNFMKEYYTYLGYPDGNPEATRDPEKLELLPQSLYQKYVNDANDIYDDIDDNVSGFVSNMNIEADKYYNKILPDAQQAIADAEQALSDAGIEAPDYPVSEYLSAFNTNLNLATGIWGGSKELSDDEKLIVPGKIQSQKCGVLNEVADLLDYITKPEFSELPALYNENGWDGWIQSWAMKAWKETKYKAAEKTMEAYEEDLDITPDYDGYEDDEAEYERLLGEISDLNDTVTGEISGLIDNYSDYADQLDSLLDELEEIVSTILTKSGNNDILNNYNENQEPMLEEAVTGINNYAYSLAAWGYYSVRQLTQSAYQTWQDLNAFVEENQTKQEQLLLVKDKVNDLMSAIASDYNAVSQGEIDFLNNTLYPKVEEAYNKAVYMINVVDPELKDEYPEAVIDGWKADMAAMKAGIGNLKAPSFTYDPDDKDAAWKEWPTDESVKEFASAAIELEQKLSALCEILDNIADIYVVDNVLSALNAGYADVYKALDAALDALDEYEPSVQEEYGAIYGKLRNALDAQQATWEAVYEGQIDDEEEEVDPSWLIALQEKFEGALHVIKTVIGTTAENAQKANDNASISNKNDELYQGYSDEFGTYLDEWDRILAEIAGYGEATQEEVSNSVDFTQGLVDSFMDYLESVKDDLYLSTTQSDVQRKLDAMSGAMNRTESRATVFYGNELLEEASEIYNEINSILESNVDIVGENIVQINTQFSALTEALNQLKAAGVNYDKNTPMETLLAWLGEVAEEDFDINTVRGNLEGFKALQTLLGESTYILGDINGDPEGAITVADLQMLINFVGEGLTFDQVKEEYGVRAAYAADVLENGVYSVGAVTKLTNMVLEYLNGTQPTSYVRKLGARKVNAKSNIIDTENTVSLALVSEENGVRTYALMLNNPTEFLAGQLDLRTNGTAQITNVYNAARSENHDVYAFDNDSYMRVILASMQNEQIAGSTGEVLYFDVEGKGDVTIDGIIFADGNYADHELSTTSTTGVNSILDTVKEYGEKIYDAAGRMYNRIQKGINIIRHKDGSVTKEIRK